MRLLQQALSEQVLFEQVLFELEQAEQLLRLAAMQLLLLFWHPSDLDLKLIFLIVNTIQINDGVL